MRYVRGMGERAAYEPGTFCWTDLSTPEPEAAKEFYCALFGWEAEDMPAGGGGVYTMLRVHGRDVAAISAQPAQQRDAGVPPLWNSYVSVQSADAAAERAAELGGSVHAGPFDVLESGRMAVVQDPQGAYFELWEPRMHLGAALVNAPGALVWNELSSPDPDAAASFYGELFGWRTQEFEGMDERYLTILNGEHANGGLRALTAPDAPPGWLVYFGIEDIEAAVARAGELGGAALAAPFEIPVAKVAVLADPQGGVFALYDGRLDP